MCPSGTRPRRNLRAAPPRGRSTVELRRWVVEGEILDPQRGFEPRSLRVEVREDPLTGQTARLLSPAGLLPPQEADAFRDLGERTRDGCPFCPELIEVVTPK